VKLRHVYREPLTSQSPRKNRNIHFPSVSEKFLAAVSYVLFVVSSVANVHFVSLIASNGRMIYRLSVMQPHATNGLLHLLVQYVLDFYPCSFASSPLPMLATSDLSSLVRHRWNLMETLSNTRRHQQGRSQFTVLKPIGNRVIGFSPFEPPDNFGFLTISYQRSQFLFDAAVRLQKESIFLL